MSTAQAILPSALTFLGGSAATETIRWLRGRRGDKATTVSAEVDAASKVSAMALGLLEPYTKEVADLRSRVGSVETDLKKTREELAEAQREQSRITGLFSQAITALRDFFDIAVSRDLPTPVVSPELRAEIGVPLLP
jgi:hypothetical protein